MLICRFDFSKTAWHGRLIEMHPQHLVDEKHESCALYRPVSIYPCGYLIKHLEAAGFRGEGATLASTRIHTRRRIWLGALPQHRSATPDARLAPDKSSPANSLISLNRAPLTTLTFPAICHLRVRLAHQPRGEQNDERGRESQQREAEKGDGMPETICHLPAFAYRWGSAQGYHYTA